MSKLFTLLLVAISSLVSPAIAADYYVAKDGNNVNPGTLSKPWKTLAYAAAHISAGDTVYIRGGVYTEGDGAFVLTDIHGNAGNYTTFTNYQNEEVILEGCAKVTGWTLHSGNIYKASWDAGTNLASEQQGLTVKSSGFVNVDKLIDANHWLEPTATIGEMAAGTWHYDQDSNLLYIWLKDSSNPSEHNIYSTTDSYYNAYPITVRRSDYVKFSNITIRIANHAIITDAYMESHDLIFENMKIYGVRAGFVPNQGSHDITFQNSEVYNTQGVGIQINSDYNTTVQNNKIHDTGSIAPWVNGPKGWGAQGVIVQGNNNTVLGNEIYDTLSDGVYLEAWGIGGPGQEIGHHNTIKHNYIHHSSPSNQIAIKFVGVDYCVAYRNTIYNYAKGIVWVGGDSGGGMTEDQKITKYNKAYNNTIVGCDIFGVQLSGSGKIENTEIKNNILYKNNVEICVSDADLMNDFTSDHNLFYLISGKGFKVTNSGDNITSLVDWRSKSSQDVNSIQDDPFFKDIGKLDFSLKSTSPCIDKGQIIEGLAYSGKSTDIGAIEEAEVKGVESPKNLRIQ